MKPKNPPDASFNKDSESHNGGEIGIKTSEDAKRVREMLETYGKLTSIAYLNERDFLIILGVKAEQEEEKETALTKRLKQSLLDVAQSRPKLFFTVLKDSDARTKQAAMYLLAKTQEKQAFKLIAKLALDKSARIRSETVYYIKDWEEAASVRLLLRMLSDKDATVRANALYSPTRIVNGMPLDFDPRAPESARQAKLAVIRNWWNNVEAKGLNEVIANGFRREGYEVANILDDSAIPILLRALNSPKRCIRINAVKFLQRITRHDFGYAGGWISDREEQEFISRCKQWAKKAKPPETENATEFRDLPWQIGTEYKHRFEQAGNEAGYNTFKITRRGKYKGTDAYWIDSSLNFEKAKFFHLYKGTSRLILTLASRPLYYKLSADTPQGKTTIECTFSEKKVAEKATRDGVTIAQVEIPLSQDVYTFDYNSFGMWAMFVYQLPLKVGERISIAAFYPPSMSTLPLTFDVKREEKIMIDDKEYDCYVAEVNLALPPGGLTMWVTKDGRLVKTIVGGAVVELVDE